MQDKLHQFGRFALAGLLLLSASVVSGRSVVAADELPSAPENQDSGFVRLRRGDDGQPLGLDTAIVTYTAKGAKENSLRVDLIGAIHVGDAAYYKSLNTAFDKYDVVLYELVARKDQVPQPGQRSAHPISALQLGMKNMLELEFQLDRIDYAKKNMVHADLTPTEFNKSMEDRGESMTQMFFRMMGQSIAEQSKDPSGSSDFRMLFAFLSKDRTVKLKRIMAEQLSDVTVATAVLDGPEGSTILTERNKRAMAVLKQSIKDGHKSIGIFYGAAHLPDMQSRLKNDFNLFPTDHRWLTAWSLKSRPSIQKQVDKP